MFYLDGVILIHLGGVLPGLIELGWWQLYRFTWDFGNAWHLVMAPKRLDWSTMDVELLWRWEWWCLSVLLIAMLCFLLGGLHVCRLSKCLVAVEHQNTIVANVQLLMSTLLPLFFIFKHPNPILKLGVSWVGSPCKPTNLSMLEPKWCLSFVKPHTSLFVSTMILEPPLEKHPNHYHPWKNAWKSLTAQPVPIIYVEQSRSILI